ncbi:acetylornithine and succinylornithine aminotransferase [Sulfobacillus acidophilus TPY]|uniref:Acetylornithine transaminase n=1 Tax=Sulfobacillus acidophilus (strain ATCC 700253 / DSM 10332 / NAL) TaxID=679936 RepID=G8U1D6_SULAD|nr:acetylornithine and succinylornithine aminotransferase [Sulfobacillus acidophilus TPY]AEW05456.1 Acetylornithine transaminase [Sulfobacillus acidophilus DSM 10332]
MADDLLTLMERYMNPGLARTFRFMGLDHQEVTATGAVVVDEEGTEYIDCAGGYGVFGPGYRHPRIVAAAHEQIEQMPLSSRVLISPPAIQLARRLAEVTPGDLQYSFFCNSGTEAVEAAIKFARISTGRTKLVAMINAFHGKTLGSLSVSGRELYQKPFAPLVPDVVHVPFGDLDALAQVMSDQVAAVVVEPIQGEGGVIVPPDGYLAGIRALCDQVGALMIVDEVQTGLGRTGRLFATEYAEGVVPDYLCLAKALGGGIVPIGAVVGRPRAWEFFESSPLIHTSTFGGNPLAARVALESINVIIDEQLPERAHEVGQWFLGELKKLAETYPTVIHEVRGRGLMIGMELTGPGAAGALMSELFQRRILAVYTLNNERVIRLMPPLVISRDLLQQVLGRLEDSLAQVALLMADLD